MMSGGYIGKDNFIKIGETIKSDDGRKYLKAGPRYHIGIEPEKTKACIVTCGGLCPGLNVVIRELVMTLRYSYGVSDIFGIKWGYGGFYDEDGWLELNPQIVRDIHTLGGTFLGTSRGGFDGDKIANAILEHEVNMVFFIGGDGTHRGIKALTKIFKKIKKNVVLIGIPKTIDNDIPIIDRSFGLQSAVEASVNVIKAANVEANCNPNGIGLVKLFGRSSGFVALYATLASRDVNICLVPEIPFYLYGEGGLLDYIFKRIEIKHHCVIVVSEGAGYAIKDYDLKSSGKTDKSGNPVLPDVGILIKEEINKYAKKTGIEVNVKYIDPTYIVRAGPANSFDCNFCTTLAQNAVHCAFAGFTNFSIGIINNHPAMIPIDVISIEGVIRKINIGDTEYISMLASTGQPSFIPVKLKEDEESDETKDTLKFD